MTETTDPTAGTPPESRIARFRAVIRRHPGRSAAVSAVVVALFAFGLYWFQPWKLFVDQSVNEAFPGAVTTADPPGYGTQDTRSEADGGGEAGTDDEQVSGATAAGEASVLFEGRFRSLEHATTGVAKVIELEDGSRLVRLEDLRTSNGPDLIVILSDTPATEDAWGAYDDGQFVSLGELKGNIGDQNYSIPPDVDLSRYRSVVVWCRRFTVGFGAAPIDVPA